jgi:hypothetical protein
MNARRPSFAAPNVQAPGIQLDLMPLQVADLRRPQTVPVGDQDHGGVAMPVATVLGRVHELLDLGRRRS